MEVVSGMDSNEFVESVLEKGFELREENVDGERAVEFLADTIQQTPAETVRVVSLIGGAASGKSTFSRTLADELSRSGLSADVLGTDDFVRGDRTWRWENFEGKDVDPIGKYDFELLNKKVEAIKQNTDTGQTVPVPTYNQTTGLAVDEGEESYTHDVGKVDVLIIEGDFQPVENPDLVIYLHVPDSQRLQNRIDRDVVHRGGDQEKTTASFNFRHSNQHLPHTLPALEQADYVVGTDASGPEWHYSIYKAVSRNPEQV